MKSKFVIKSKSEANSFLNISGLELLESAIISIPIYTGFIKCNRMKQKELK